MSDRITIPDPPLNYRRAGSICLWAGIAGILVSIVGMGVALEKASSRDYPEARPVTCYANLDQISIGVKAWLLSHNGQFPFNLSTNSGGTMELCGPGKDGFDTNAFLHFRVLSNELGTPVLLVCPRDHATKPAADFAHLTPANLTYQLRTGTNITEQIPDQILLRCPIHNTTVRVDGTITSPAPQQETTRSAILTFWALSPMFRFVTTIFMCLALGGCFLIAVGARLSSLRK